MKFSYYTPAYFLSFLLCFLLTFSSETKAESNQQVIISSPYDTLKKTGNNLFSRIASSQGELKTNPLFMQTIVEEELMPVIDYQYASYKILGKHLRKTTKKQRVKFVNSMRSNLVKTYASALKQYKTQQVIYESDKGTQGKRIIAVKAQIIDMNAPTIDVIFKMRQNKKTGQWKAFDMVIEGISLLSTKQAEISKRITTQGLDQVTVDLVAL